jgi:hypothetical protein
MTTLPSKGVSSTGLLNERELQSLAWAVRRASKNADGFGDKGKTAQRAFEKLRHAAKATPAGAHEPEASKGEASTGARAH